ncbi:transcription antitermination protein NusB [Cardinium endosymbiont of Nabis limbatus]|uniref:transcription antitermination protein NusB n=1 Tax=Cardinium endosymbiont of Nabis limbatus TaxID=3066217 RepID=UPI003AF396A7
MENFLIPRRFVRIKALQNLYAYTIAQIAHKKGAIDQIKKDFIFDPFLDAPDQKEPLAKAQNIAVALFTEAVTAALPAQDFIYADNNKIEQSVRNHLTDYLEAVKQAKIRLQNGFSQSKESIYMALVSILLLLVEWYKSAKETDEPSKSADHLLKKQLVKDPLLEALYSNSNWIKSIDKNGISWAKDQDQIQSWYRQCIEPAEMPKSYRSDPNNSLKFLEYMLEHIIFQEGPINDFFAMADLYWDEHKRIVKKILTWIFTMGAAQSFNAFTLFWDNLAPKWSTEATFYTHLLMIVIDNNARYEAMIDAKTEKWDSKRILLTDKLILKLALAELLHFKEIPFKVSINEYIEIAKWYGTSKSGIFINGVLEGILNGRNKEKEKPITQLLN